MTTTQESSATAPAKPKQFDRFLTTGRAAAVLALMLVHWGLAITLKDGLSQVGMDSIYGWDWTGWLTWAFVWIGPVWFGMFGALSMKAARGRVRTFYAKRYKRLLIPYFTFAVVMVSIQLVLWATNTGQCGGEGAGGVLFTMDPIKALTWLLPYPHFDCFGITQAPFWFLTVYLFLTLVLPLFVRLYDKPFWRYKIPVLLILAPFFFDFLTFLLGSPKSQPPLLFLFQLMTVWGLWGYVGFFYADGSYKKPSVKKWYIPAFAGFALITAVMASGPWPDALWSGTKGNQFPPTAAYLTGGLSATALVLWARESIIKFSQLHVVDKCVDLLAKYNYTIYIWHQVPMLIVWWGVTWLGFMPSVQAWPVGLQRLFFFTLPWPFLLVIVKVFFRAESWDFPPRWWQRRRERATSAEETLEDSVRL